MRPLAAALAVLAATQGGRFELRGVPRMHERPIGDLVDALRPLGCRIDDLGQAATRRCAWRPAGGALATGRADPRARRRVQPVPHRPAAGAAAGRPASSDVVIEVDGELISKPYIEITLNLLARFGIAVQREGWQRFTIPQGSRYRSPGSVHVEGDASSASLLHRRWAPSPPAGAPVRIEGVGSDSIQGDIRFVEAARAMGAAGQRGPNWLEVRRGAWPLRAITLDCNHIPDAAMTLAVMALYADGPTRADQHRQLARQGNRPHRRDGRRAAQARRRGGRGRRLHRGDPPAALAAGRHPHLRRPPHGDVRVAGGLQPAGAAGGVPVRILDPQLRRQDLPGLLRGAVRRRRAPSPAPSR